MEGMKMEVGNSMGNMMDKFFRKVRGVVFDLQSGSVALKNSDGSVSVLDTKVIPVKVAEDKTIERLEYNLKNIPFNVTMSMPAFALHTEMDKVKPGDLVVSDRGVLGFVIEKGMKEGITNTIYTVLRPNGEMSSVVLPSNNLFGKEGIMVVQSMDFKEGGMNPMMMMAMMGDDIDPMMMMLMSGGMGNMGGDAKGGMNPMMMMALAGKGNIDPMMMMLMSGGMGDMNPMMMMAMMGGLDKKPKSNVWQA